MTKRVAASFCSVILAGTTAFAQPAVQPPSPAPSSPPPGTAPAQAAQPAPYPAAAPAPYPPPAAYPPPAYPAYPPPPYGYGYPVPVPVYAAPAPVPAEALVVDGWDPKVPTPEGYHLNDDINIKVFSAGIGLLGASWLGSVLVAGVATSDDVNASGWTPLYIPLAGPFVAIRTLDADRFGTSLLLSDGILQIGGAIGIVAGLVDHKYQLVRYDMHAAPITPPPPEERSTPLTVLGGTLGGVGAVMFVASGIAWLAASGDAATARSECPNKVCVQGSRGAEALTDARTAEHTSSVLFAFSLPAMTAGMVVLGYTGGLRSRPKTVGFAPVLGPGRAGGEFEMRF